MTHAAHPVPTHQLAMRVREVGQLFNSMDPTPFLNKDLDPDAEAYIESWAFDYSPNSRFQINLHIEQMPQDDTLAERLNKAIHNHFSYKAERTRRHLRRLLRQGRTSMAVGIVFVSLCLVAADTISRMGPNPGYNIARESLTIVGWVAMWRPMQIFLYDWWPVLRKIRLYERLSAARIHVMSNH
ncbi:MAG: hypothetical protein AB1722_11655 [Pseudomonadota bacterium]